MSQCVPSWDLDENPRTTPRLNLRPHSNSNSLPPDIIPTLDYEVAELTWENGQLAMHGLGLPRVTSKYTWDKPRAGGTLESIVNQAASHLTRSKPAADGKAGDDLVPWFDHHLAAARASVSVTKTMDALVPCSTTIGGGARESVSTHVTDGMGTCVVGCSTRVGSCSGANTGGEVLKRARVARAPAAVAQDWSSRDNSSVSGSAATCGGRDSWQVTLDTCDRELGTTAGGFTTTSMGSPENTTSSAMQSTKATTAATATADDHDSVCHSRSQREAVKGEEKKKGAGKSSISTKRSRAAAVHNQSERKRRDKINQRMKTLQKLVPNSSKTDKASMLDEVIEYLKQLQAQIHMMSRMNMPSMMLPMTTLQQQLQLSMMAAAAPMGMAGMGMGPMGMAGMGCMDINSIGRHNLAGIPPVLHPAATAAFMPVTSWDGTCGDHRLSAPAATVIPDPMSTFLACQSQPMTMDAYSRMAALYQQLHQPPPSGTKS